MVSQRVVLIPINIPSVPWRIIREDETDIQRTHTFHVSSPSLSYWMYVVPQERGERISFTRNETKCQKSSHAYYTAAAFPLSLYPPTTTMSDLNPYELRAKYTRFRILVIGRANAGKTTLLQRVCNTTEDPCIYDENNKNLVSLQKPQDKVCF